MSALDDRAIRRALDRYVRNSGGDPNAAQPLDEHDLEAAIDAYAREAGGPDPKERA